MHTLPQEKKVTREWVELLPGRNIFDHTLGPPGSILNPVAVTPVAEMEE